MLTRSTRTRTPKSRPIENLKREEEDLNVPTAPRETSSSPTKRKTPDKPTPATKRARSSPTTATTSPADTKPLKAKSATPSKPKFAAYLQTPYPDYPRPTPEDCKLVVERLGSIHGVPVRPGQVVKEISGNGVNCGAVPSVLDALIRTILSQNTSNANSSRAYASLLSTFGPSTSQKKAVDLVKVHGAPQAQVMESIKSGGLANVKSKVIKQVLQQVWDRNFKLSPPSSSSFKHPSENDVLMNVKPASSPIPIKKEADEPAEEIGSPPLTPLPEDLEDTKPNVQKENSINANDVKDEGDSVSDAGVGVSQEQAEKLLSLDYVHDLDDEHAMKELESFKGVGPKTASCVLLFCLNRDSFAVDTHVFRLSKQLGWVPPKATRETTYEHLDVRIPGELKYALHVLLIAHGKSCSRCAANNKTSRPSLGPCPLVNLSTVSAKATKKGAGGKKASVKEEEDDEDNGEGVEEETEGTSAPVQADVKQDVKVQLQEDLESALTANHGG